MSHAPPDTRLKGVPLSPGVAMGRVCLCVKQSPMMEAGGEIDSDDQVEQLQQALDWLHRQRESLAYDTEARLGQDNADIFHAHSLMLTDTTFQHALFKAIEGDGCSAGEAVESELGLLKRQLESADSEYLQQRVDDINEIEQALLDYLNRVVSGRQCREASNCSMTRCQLGNDHILVSQELTASLPIETDSNTVGFVIEQGGANSHGVILARALGRPAVGNIHNLSGRLPLEADILIDGDRGEVILNPSQQTLHQYRASVGKDKQALHSVPVPELKVMANIQQSSDVDAALAAGAEGVGLYRTEIELLTEGRLLNEDEQATRYTEVVKAMAGKPVCIRLLDLGADKTAQWLSTSPQAASFTGQRGAGLLLACPELLRNQARALVRASDYGPVHVLYPMIIDAGQFLELRELFDQAVTDLGTGDLCHGVLFEIPSACLAAQTILEVADFGCIGTNDLIQYLFAQERSASQAYQSGIESNEVLWTLIKNLSAAAATAGKPMAICGELAGNPALTKRILDAGIDTVSTSPTYIAKVRTAARELG